jgi:F-type H+-transporting ATPase subunit epsilon
MADRTFTVDIVTPERVVVHDEATSLVAPGVVGSFGILPNHAPLLSELAIGELRYRRNSGQEQRLAIGGGFLQVFNNQVTVLADTAERAEEINTERARRALERYRGEAQEVTSLADERRLLAEAAVERARNRLRVAGG